MTKPVTFYVIGTAYWGRGPTIAEARKVARRHRPSYVPKSAEKNERVFEFDEGTEVCINEIDSSIMWTPKEGGRRIDK